MNPDSSSGRWSIFKLAVVAFALLMVLGVVVVGVVIGLRVQAVRRASPTAHAFNSSAPRLPARPSPPKRRG